MGLIRITPPAALIDLALAKSHLRVESDMTDDDTLIAAYAAAAVEKIEGYLERSILQQTWRYTLDGFPFWGPYGWPSLAPGYPVWPTSYPTPLPIPDLRLRLPRPQLIAVQSVKYVDPSGTLVTLDPSQYVVDTDGLPGSIAPVAGAAWPAASQVPNAIQIVYNAGFSDDPTLIPPSIIAAVLLELGDLYTRREVGEEMNDSAKALVAQYVYREAA